MRLRSHTERDSVTVRIDTPIHKATPYRLGRWLIDPGACSIVDARLVTRIEPRAMAVLNHLAAHPGQTISRDEFLDHIWRTRHVVDEALTKCISQLRRALDDDKRTPSYIKTIPKLGYRLLVHPTPHAIEAVAPASAPNAPFARRQC